MWTTLAMWMALAAHAGQCPNLADAHPSVGLADATSRIAYLHGSNERGRRTARRWALGWGLGFVALTATQAALIPLAGAESDRRTLYVGIGSTLLGAGFMAVSPPLTPRHLRRLDALMADPDADPCEVVAQAEHWMLQASAMERFGTGWLTHAGNLLVNVAAGLILALGWDQWRDAWITTAVGTLVGEVMIWTQPMDRTRDLEVYRRGTWIEPDLHGVPMLWRGGAGVSLQGRW